MTRDWLLTLLAISLPYLLGATAVVLALIRRAAKRTFQYPHDR